MRGCRLQNTALRRSAVLDLVTESADEVNFMCAARSKAEPVLNCSCCKATRFVSD